MEKRLPDSTIQNPSYQTLEKALSRLHFKQTEKIKEMYRRHAETRLQEDEQALDHGLEIGRGGFCLRFNEEQYQVLRRPSGARAQGSRHGHVQS